MLLKCLLSARAVSSIGMMPIRAGVLASLVGLFSGCVTPEERATRDANAIVEQARANRAAQEEANERRRHEDQERRAAEKAAAEKAVADQKERERRALEDSCAQTRPQRLADLEEKIRDFHAEMKKIAPHVDWLVAHCKYEDTRAILVQRQRVKDGVIVRTKQVGQENDVTCDAPLPKGLTQEQADRATYFNSLEKDDPLVLYYSVDRNDFGQENSRCASADSAAGVDLYVKLFDIEAQKAILGK